MAEVKSNENGDVSMVDAAEDTTYNEVIDSRDPEKIIIVRILGIILFFRYGHN